MQNTCTLGEICKKSAQDGYVSYNVVTTLEMQVDRFECLPNCSDRLALIAYCSLLYFIAPFIPSLTS